MRYFFLCILTLLAFETFAQREVSGVIEDLDFDDEIVLMGTPYWGAHKIVYTDVTYDVSNSMFGLNISNGFENFRFLPPSFPYDMFVYQMNYKTNFHNDYMFGASIGRLMYHKYMERFHKKQLNGSLFLTPKMISAGYHQYHYPSKGLIHKDTHISIMVLFKHFNDLTIKTGYQILNDYHNWGVSAGYQQTFSSRYPNGISVGLSAGYYFDYYTYSIFLQGLLYEWKKQCSFKLSFDRIDTYNFFNIGLSYFFICL